MRFPKNKTRISFLLSSLLFASFSVEAQDVRKAESEIKNIKADKSQRINYARDALRSARADFKLDDDNDFDEINSEVDEFGKTHVRFQQTYKNIKVWNGTLITHMDDNQHFLPNTNRIRLSPKVDINARVLPENAVLIAEHNIGKKIYYDTPPTAELVIFPITERVIADRFVSEKNLNASMMEEHLLKSMLAYHVHLEAMHTPDGPLSMDYIIDANTGDIVQNWSSLQQAFASATGAHSQYNGTVSINTNSTTTGYELRDMQRGIGGPYGNNVVLYANIAKETIADIATDATNTWGNGSNYAPGGSNDTRQTAAVDAAYSVAATWDFLKKVVNRDGYDGNSTAMTTIILDQPTGADAEWWATSNTLRAGIGSVSNGGKNFNSLDVLAHEIGHGVTFSTSKLSTETLPCPATTCFRESSQINEGASDILGTMVEFYVRGGGLAGAYTYIPATAATANWIVGDEVGSPRNMLNTEIWTADQHYKEPHLGGQVLSHMFYLLANGGQGVAIGLGNDKAFRIFYRAWIYYFTPNTDFTAARQAMITAARDLYGANQSAEQAVWNAFAAVKVGPAWSLNVACGVVESGHQLNTDPLAIPACNDSYLFGINSDGALQEVTHQNLGTAIWSSASGVNKNAYAAMQEDGNFVLYKTQLSAPASTLWNTGTWDYPQSYFRVANDGNLIVYTATGLPIWSRVGLPPGSVPVAATGTNIDLGSAQYIPPSTPGVLSTLINQQSHFYQIDIPAGKSLNADFVGTPLKNTYGKIDPDYWETSIISVGGAVLSAVRTDAYTPRRTATYQNSSAAPVTVYIQIHQYLSTSSLEDKSLARHYSVAFRLCSTLSCDATRTP